MNVLDWFTVALTLLFVALGVYVLAGSVQNRRSPKGKGRY